jgi:2-C-methyl-D-erythritol 4-phosphate cytidylyltransferase
MNVALIFAGGSGTRMNSISKPKQFLQLHGKEIIIHTIENFEKHSEIDGIIVVCIEPWMEFMKTLLEKHGITKVKWLVSGGDTGQESRYKGLCALKNNIPDDSIVLIHDGVRPLITSKLISDCIGSVKKYGNAITITPVIETIVSIDEESGKINNITNRNECFHAKAPQCFKFCDLWEIHQQALTDGITNSIDSASLLMQYGYDLYTVSGDYENIKITTPSDFYIFRALYEARENSQVFGL